MMLRHLQGRGRNDIEAIRTRRRVDTIVNHGVRLNIVSFTSIIFVETHRVLKIVSGATQQAQTRNGRFVIQLVTLQNLLKTIILALIMVYSLSIII